MAQTSAPTEPKTLEAAFSDHAQRTLGACHSSRRFRPVGNGMPMTKPSGAINATVNATLRAHGSQTSEESSEDTTMASSAVSNATRPSQPARDDGHLGPRHGPADPQRD